MLVNSMCLIRRDTSGNVLLVPGAGIEPAWTYKVRGILSPLCLPISPSGQSKQADFGGGGRNRTGVDGFAGRCITTLPPRQLFF